MTWRSCVNFFSLCWKVVKDCTNFFSFNLYLVSKLLSPPPKKKKNSEDLVLLFFLSKLALIILKYFLAFVLQLLAQLLVISWTSVNKILLIQCTYAIFSLFFFSACDLINCVVAQVSNISSQFWKQDTHKHRHTRLERSLVSHSVWCGCV